MEVVSEIENNESYFCDGLLDLNKIEKIDFDLKQDQNFRTSLYKDIKRVFSRKNILKFGIMTGEVAVKIEETTGNVMLTAVDKDQILKRINTFSREEKERIKYVHISTCQIIIKSTFMKGIDSPIELLLRDNRLTNYQESIIANGSGNLKMGKIKFDVNLQIGLVINDLDLDRSIILEYKLLKDNFMKKGNHPFSICYRINYALSNSHHSIEFRHSEKIHIDELFSPLIELKSPSIRRKEESSRLISRTVSERNLGETRLEKVGVPRLKKPVNLYEEEKEIEKLKGVVSTLSVKIDSLNEKI